MACTSTIMRAHVRRYFDGPLAVHPKSCPAQHAVTVAPRAHADSKSVRANQLIGYGAKEGTRGMTIVRQDAADCPRWKYLPSVNLCSSRVGAMQPNQSWTTTALRWACVLPMRTRTNKAQQTRKTLGNFAMSFEIVARPPALKRECLIAQCS